MDGHGDRTGGHAELSRNTGVIAGAGGIGEKAFQLLELGGFASRGVFFAQSSQRLLKERQSPSSVVDVFGCELRSRFELVLSFRRSLVPGKMDLSAAPLDGVGTFPFVSQKMFERSQQKGAELAPLTVG